MDFTVGVPLVGVRYYRSQFFETWDKLSSSD